MTFIPQQQEKSCYKRCGEVHRDSGLCDCYNRNVAFSNIDLRVDDFAITISDKYISKSVKELEDKIFSALKNKGFEPEENESNEAFADRINLNVSRYGDEPLIKVITTVVFAGIIPICRYEQDSIITSSESTVKAEVKTFFQEL